MPPSVLIVDDERSIRLTVGNILRDAGCETRAVESLGAAREELEAYAIDVVILDQQLKDGNGLSLLEEMARSGAGVETIVLTAHGDINNAVRAMKSGAFHYLTKPFDADELIHLVVKAGEVVGLRRELSRLREQQMAHMQAILVGDTPAMRQIADMITRVAPLNTSVLLYGESGTGKEVVARAIHASGPRANRPFVAINCAAIPNDLLESELFGYEQGAFTGAKKQKRGLIEMADKGTLFLDEISSMKADMQAKLLRVIETRSFTRLGSTSEVKVDMRLLTASNRDLPALIERELFREDLYFRVSVIRIDLPPLRERLVDLPQFVAHFLEQFTRETGKPICGVSPQALEAMRAYRWPGNIRELRNVVERAVVFCDGPEIQIGHLPSDITRPPP